MSTVLYAIPTLGTRNGWLPVSIASVLRQAVDGLRTVVVTPSGSPAEKIAASMGVECLPSDRPGLSAAINDVWKTYGTDYDYFGWLADDDALAPLSLLAAVDHLDRHPGCAAVYGRMREIRSDGSTVTVTRPGRLAALLLPYGTQQVPGVGGLFRADAVREAGYLDEGLGYAMDYAIFLALRRLGSLDYLPVELAAVRTHGGRITENRTDGGREITDVRERAFTARQVYWYGRLTWVADAADRVYGSVLRRMPAEPAPLVGGVPYVDPAAVEAR